MKRTTSIAAAATALLVILTGCSGSSASTTPAPVTPTAQPSATVAPTVAPTPVPATPAPTLAPTPTPAPTDAPEYTVFATRSKDGGDQFTSLHSLLVKAGAASDVASYYTAAQGLLAWADTESRWMTANPPLDCYRPAYAAYATALSDVFRLVFDISLLKADSNDPNVANIVDAELAAADQFPKVANLVGASVCDGTSTPTPTSATVAEAKKVYLAAAKDINARYEAVFNGTPTMSDTEMAQAVIALEGEAVSRLQAMDLPVESQAAASDYAAKVGDVVDAFKAVLVAGSESEAKDAIRLAFLFLGTDQTDAATALRKTLGLPAAEVPGLL